MDKFTSHKSFGHDLIALQMQGKMLFIVGCFLLSVYLLCFTATARIFLGSDGISQLFIWVTSKVLSPLLPGHELSLFVKGKLITASAAEFARSKTLLELIINNLWKLILAALVPLPVFFIFPKILAHYRFKEQRRLQPKYIDGAKLLPPQLFKDQVDQKYRDTFLPFGGWYDDQDKFHSINLPTEVENAHIAIYGGTRSGKTVMISQMIDALRERDDICLILDQKGDYTPKFYSADKDHILNVLDQRCMPWSFWHDLQDNPLLRKAEIEAVASGLIPDSKETTEQFFRDAARDVLAGLLTYLDQQDKRTYTDLWQTINQPREGIASILANIGHRGHIHVSESGKQSQGVISVLMQFGKVFEYASVLDSESKFGIQDWLTAGKGYIFLTNYDSIRDTLRPMLSLFINFLAKKILTAEENLSGRRIWIFLDEFGSLHKISTLIDILTRGGSKGVCVVLATQDRGQVEEIYGPNLTDAIFNSCNSWAAFRCKDPSTARIIVDRIGEWRFERQEETISDRFDDGGDSINIASRIHREKLLLDSDIMGQEKLQAYIHIDGCDFSHVKIEHKFFDPHCPAFIVHPDVDLSKIHPPEQDSIKDSDSVTTDDFIFNEVGV